MRGTPDIGRTYKNSSRHRRELEASERCGCFYCLAVFGPQEIVSWLGEGDGTALCPRCCIDAVIGSASGLPLTQEFLDEMRQHWFNDSPAEE